MFKVKNPIKLFKDYSGRISLRCLRGCSTNTIIYSKVSTRGNLPQGMRIGGFGYRICLKSKIL